MSQYDANKEKLERAHELDTNKEKEGNGCPQCGELNETGAKFCAECGNNIYPERQCTSCKSRVSPNADICESCGEWLLKDKCKFCYADLEEGQVYCGECGNSVEGIRCPKCTNLSYFDFCKSCNIPLTEAARKSKEDFLNDPASQELLNLIESSGKEVEEISVSEQKELLKMKAYMAKVEKKGKKVVYVPLFSDNQKESIFQMGEKAEKEIKRIEDEKRRKEEEERRKKEEAKQKLEEAMRQMGQRTFSSNQDARKFFSSRKPLNARGWVCNYADATHDYPEECCEPWHGGYWVI